MIKVSVLMVTYNHEKYIEEAINGVLMQECDFNVELIIADDNSPDNTEAIVKNFIKNHPKKSWVKYTRHEVNKGILPNTTWVKNQATGKYVALCEGDDYWTDALKLQKQVDFLESNTSYGMIYTKARSFYQDKKRHARKCWGGNATTFDQLIQSNKIPTVSTLIRRNILLQYNRDIQPSTKNWKMGDYPVWLYFALKSKIHFMNEETCVYRIFSESASHSNDIEKREVFTKSYYEIKKFFLEFANVKYNPLNLEDELLSSLATNALIKKNRLLSKKYLSQINNLTIKDKIKLIICNSVLLTYVYNINK